LTGASRVSGPDVPERGLKASDRLKFIKREKRREEKRREEIPYHSDVSISAVVTR
jgi:hypothetical protein